MPLSAIIAQPTKLAAQRICPVQQCSRAGRALHYVTNQRACGLSCAILCKRKALAERMRKLLPAHLQQRSAQDRQWSQGGISRHFSTQAHLGQKTHDPCPAIEALYRGNQEYMKAMGLTNPGLLQDLANEGQRTCSVQHSIAVMVPHGTFCSVPCRPHVLTIRTPSLVPSHFFPSFYPPFGNFAARIPPVTNSPPRSPIYACRLLRQQGK